MKHLPPVLAGQNFQAKESTKKGVTSTVFDVTPAVLKNIDRQRTTVGSHERIGIFRVFGRDAGYTALYTAYVTAARCCIPEYKFDLQHLTELLINDKRSNPSNYSLVIVSEGAENH